MRMRFSTTKITFFLFFMTFVLQSNAQYCTPTTNCGYGDGIIEFGVGSFNNQSTCEADMMIAGYGDFTTLTGLEFAQGAPNSVVLLSGYLSQQVSIWIDADNNMAFDSSELVLIDAPVGTSLATIEVAGPNIPLGTYRLRVQAAYGTSSSVDPCIVGDYGETEDYMVTIVAPPACIATSNTMATGVTDTEAMISWTESGTATTWDLEIVEDGNAPTGIPTTGYDDVNTNPVMISGLNPESNYSIFVRADCSGNNVDVSAWAGAGTLTTMCAPLVPLYTETFEDLALSVVPNCWLEYTEGEITDGPSVEGLGAWTGDDFGNDGSNVAARINLYQGNAIRDWIVTPLFDLTTGGPYQVEFDFSITEYAATQATNLGSDDEVAFLVSSDNGSTWTSLQTWTASDNVDPAGEKMIYDLASYAGSTIQFAFWGSDGMVDDPEDNDIFVDNFFVREPPTCVETSGLTVGGISDVSAIVSWTENGSATAWDIEFGPIGFTPTGMPSAGYDDVSNPTTIMGLAATTGYEVYVRADCSGNNSDASTWNGPISFTTSCGSYAAPYFEDFYNDPQECWIEADGGDLATGPTDIGYSAWVSDDFGNLGNNDAIRINLYNVGDNDWLISPMIDISNGEPYQVAFDFAITEYADTAATNLGSDDQVMFLISTDNMTTWTVLQSWTAADNVSPSGEHMTYDLTDYSGVNNAIFAFYATEGLVDDPEDNDIFVDNFEVVANLNVPPALTFTSTAVLCNGGSNGEVDLTVSGTPPFSYEWSNTATTEDLTNLIAGNYVCTVTDGNGLSATITVDVIEPTAIDGTESVMDETTVGQNDGSIDFTVSGGTAPYTYTWDNGVATEDIDNLPPGTYCVTVTDANGCTFSSCAEVMAGVVSTNDIDELTSFELTPNPVVNEQIWLNIEFAVSKNFNIVVLNSVGQEVYRTQILTTSSLKHPVAVAELSSGLYFVKLESLQDGQSVVKPFVKQ